MLVVRLWNRLWNRLRRQLRNEIDAGDVWAVVVSAAVAIAILVFLKLKGMF